MGEDLFREALFVPIHRSGWGIQVLPLAAYKNDFQRT